jgi:hypothetical protein
MPRARFVLSLLAALPLIGPVASAQSPVPSKVVGMNFSGLSPVNSSWDVADLMKASNTWNSGAVSTSTYNADDWPTFIPAGQNVGTNVRLPVNRLIPNIPLGTYTLSWEGQGSFFLSGGGGFVSRTNAGPGTASFTVTNPSDQLFFQINSTTPANPLRNLKVLMPGHAPGQPHAAEQFNSTFLQQFAPFKTLRFMDWASTNNNTLVSWNDRPRESNRTWANSKGVPVETQIALANRQLSDPWVNMPVKADDDFVRQYATLVRDTLDPRLKVYVEYGNEVWNPQFTVEHDHVRSLAAQRYGNAQFWYRTWAEEARRDFAIWKEVFAETGQADRILRVAAAQTVNRFHSPRFLNHLYTHPSDTNPSGERLFDVLSMAAYVGVSSGSYNASTTKDKIIDDLFADLSRQMNPNIGTDGLPTGDFRWNRQLADQHGVDLIAYEGGQHVVPPSATATWYNAYVQAQRDPRMYDLYSELLEQYLDVLGADGFMNFSSVASITEFGAWGVLESGAQDPLSAHKYRALVDYITRTTIVPEPGASALSALAASVMLVRPRRNSPGSPIRPS